MTKANRNTIVTLLLLIIPLYTTGRCIHYYLTHIPPLDVLWVAKQDYNLKNEHQKMAKAYERLLVKYPHRNHLNYSLGWAYYKVGRYGEAAKFMQRYVTNNPFYPEERRKYIHNVLKKADHVSKS